MEAGRFPAAMTTTRWFNHIHLNTPERVPRACAARLAWGFVLVVIRIVATSTLLVSVNHAV